MSSLPPLPPPLPTAAHPRPATKPPQRNGCLIALAIGGIALVALVAILAALAIPAYQQYVLRSKVMAAITATHPLRNAIDTRLAQGGECPGSNIATDFKGMQGVERVEIGQLAEDSTRCVYAIHLGGTGSEQLDGRTIWMDRAKSGGGAWNCRSDLDNRYLPPACRED
ncbi:MAG: pilin [Proteobacteria bacterium]|nr:pilin [Pseudomonadota bacterium]